MIPVSNLNKSDILFKYSNPNIVQNNAYKYLGNVIVYKSTNKNKKYMIIKDGKKINFGQMYYEDYTKHNDINRLNNFRKRNYKWKDSKKYTPAYLSYYLLW